MTKIHYDYLKTLFSNICYVDEEDEYAFARINTNDEGDIRKMARSYIMPIYNTLTDESKQLVKETYRFALFRESTIFECFLDYNQSGSALIATGNAVEVFSWIWDEMFPNESFEIVNIEKYELLKGQKYSNILKFTGKI